MQSLQGRQNMLVAAPAQLSGLAGTPCARWGNTRSLSRRMPALRVLGTYAPPRPSPTGGDAQPNQPSMRVEIPAQPNLTTKPAKTPPTSINAVDVQSYVEANFVRYNGDASFLAGPTAATKKQMEIVEKLLLEEQKKGILDVDTVTPSGITAFPPGYIDPEQPELEKIKGLQTDKPLKRAIKPLGGVRTVAGALESYGYTLDPTVDEIFSKYRKTHNQGVFDAYTPEMRAARKAGILTGLPDGYGRGRIIGDYRRVALYGVDALIAAKKDDWKNLLNGTMTEETIRLREEVVEQIRSLMELKEMAKSYGDDISKPATDSREAVQWLYYGYLAAVKEQDGAAMSMGRIDAFLDTYFEKDLAAGTYTEEQVQELIDHLVVKLRLVRHLRSPEYNQLFAGDPTWVTCSIGGTAADGSHMVTKTSYRLLQTLYNLSPAPEPNMTVLWSNDAPLAFKKFCADVSIDTSSIQYENDALMTPLFGSDYGIACCVSAMRIGKDMQYFGARSNLPKLLLYIMNGGRDEITGDQVGPQFPALKTGDENTPLDYEEVTARLEEGMDWLARLYCNTMNVIHYMHDKYDYERIEMALHDTIVRRLLAFGISGLSVTADSLSAIKYAKVYPIRDERGVTKDFRVEGEFPAFGNDDERVDDIAAWLVRSFYSKLAQQETYRGSVPTLSALTITSNVVYGKKTGSTPDGRKQGEPFAPGANPLHGRDCTGALASLNSVAHLPYEFCLDGISNTFSLVPSVLGKEDAARTSNLVAILDGYFTSGGHHINVNVLNRAMLEDAMEHPDKYPLLTIRVSGYAVHFAKLTREQQLEVIARTFHESI